MSRRLFVWAFAAFFGCISLVGQGLHCFVGHVFHRGAATRLADRCCDDPHPVCCHAEHRPVAADAQPADAQAAVVSGSGHGDCPICGFFAQAQRALDLPPARGVTLAMPLATSAERTFFVFRYGAYRSRAPPAGAILS